MAATSWPVAKSQEEALKQAGRIKTYKVLVAVDPRESEGDAVLAVEYPNRAVSDRSVPTAAGDPGASSPQPPWRGGPVPPKARPIRCSG